jgi:hypothetical protein
MRRRNVLILIMAANFLISLTTSAGIPEDNPAPQIKQRRPIRLVLPDLVLQKIETEAVPQGATRVRVNISYWVHNNSTVPSSCCPTEAGKKAWEDNPADNMLYRIRVEGRTLPSGTFTQLANGGSVGTMAKANETQKYTASDVHSVRVRKEYRVIVDYGNWIREKSENNNMMTKKQAPFPQ